MDHVQQWEQALVEEYYNHRWRQLLEPLCDKLQQWKDGKISNEAMEETIEALYREACEIRNLFSQRQDRLVLLIQWLDREWFEKWVKRHTPPPGARLVDPVE